MFWGPLRTAVWNIFLEANVGQIMQPYGFLPTKGTLRPGVGGWVPWLTPPPPPGWGGPMGGWVGGSSFTASP